MPLTKLTEELLSALSVGLLGVLRFREPRGPDMLRLA